MNADDTAVIADKLSQAEIEQLQRIRNVTDQAEAIWLASKHYWLKLAAKEAEYYAANSSTARNIATGIRRLRTGKNP